jgi:hypothetical protein
MIRVVSLVDCQLALLECIPHFWQQRNMGAVFSVLMVLVHSNVLRLSAALIFLGFLVRVLLTEAAIC